MSMEAQTSVGADFLGWCWRRAIAGWSWLVLETSWFILAKTGKTENAERKNKMDEKRMASLGVCLCG